MRKLVMMVLVTWAAGAAATDDTSRPADAAGQQGPSPQAKKTVQAFVGTWMFNGQVTGVGGADKAAKATETLVCRKAAGGRAVSCTGRGKVQGMGPVEDATLVAWDEGAKNVRFVGMGSMGEVHDHTCAWKDETSIACEPLAVTSDGQPATVDLQISWTDAKHMTFTETTTTKDGSKSVFGGKATRK